MIRILLIALALILAPTLAQAEEPPTIVVFADNPPLVDAEAFVRSAWTQQQGEVPGVRFVSANVVFPPAQSAVFLGDADVRGCEGEPTSPADLTALNRKALDLLAEMEYLSASTSLAEADRLIPCLSGAPRPMDLAAYHMLRGIVAFETDGAEEASARFEEGLLVSPFLQWDERFPPSVKPAFDAAVKTAIAAEKAFLSVSEGILEGGALWLDGLAIDPRTRTTTVYEGTHLLQWKQADAPVVSWVVNAGAGDSLILMQRGDALQALLRGRADRVLSDYAWTQVLAPVERGPESSLFVAESAGIVLFHRFDRPTDSWVLADVDAVEDYRARGRRLRNAGIVASISGGVMAIVGVVSVFDGAVLMYQVDQDIRRAALTSDSDDDALGPVEVFNNAQADHRSGAQQVEFGLTFGVVGSLLSIGSVPIIAIGEGQAHALGLNRKARRAARRVARAAEAKGVDPEPAEGAPTEEAAPAR